MYQRTVRITIGAGIMPDLLLRLDLELVPPMRAAPGFLGYFAVAADDETSVVTTRVFTDLESLAAETESAAHIAHAISEEFAFTSFDTIVDGDVGVGYTFGPIGIFTP